MPHVELYVNDKLLDLKGDESIEVDYSIFDIEKIGSRGGARSYEFNLPKTNRNKSVLENPEMVNNLSSLPYSRMPCLILVDGVDVLIRFAEIASVKDSYAIRVYGGNADLFSSLKDLKLEDIDLSEYDEFWVLDEIVASLPNTEGIIYPIIDYHSDSPNGYLNNDNRVMRCDFMLTSVFVNTLIDKIFSGTDYIVTNTIENETVDLIVPYNGRQLVRNKDARRYEATFTVDAQYTTSVQMPPSPVLSYGTWIKFDSVTNASNNYGSYWQHGNFNPFAFGAHTNIFFRFAENTRFTLEYDLQFVGDGIGFSNPAEITVCTNFTAVIDPSQETPTTVQHLFTGDTSLDFSITGEFVMETGDYNTFLSNFDDFNCLMIFSIRSFTIKAGSYVKIKNVEILQEGQLKYIDTYQQKNYLTPAKLLPDLTQSDFIKAYMQMFCLLPVVNEAYKTARLIKFSDLLSNIYNSYDWSDKIDNTDDPQLTFISSKYGQKNLFSYTQDGKEPKPIGTDGTVLINNGNLELEKTIVELPLASTFTNKRLVDNDVPQIGVFKDGSYNDERVPRILTNDRIDLGGDLTLDDTFNAEVYTEDVPLPYFIKSGGALNLGFDDSLLDTYYELLSNIMSRVKIISLDVRLSAADISQLDFSRPVFISQYESYFYISSVKGFSYTESKSTLVELVKLNING